jgi:hypothetical protein
MMVSQVLASGSGNRDLPPWSDEKGIASLPLKKSNLAKNGELGDFAQLVQANIVPAPSQVSQPSRVAKEPSPKIESIQRSRSHHFI